MKGGIKKLGEYAESFTNSSGTLELTTKCKRGTRGKNHPREKEHYVFGNIYSGNLDPARLNIRYRYSAHWRSDANRPSCLI